MPQLLRHYEGKFTQFEYGPSIDKRPEHAAMVMQVIGHWSAIDQMLNALLADLLRLDVVVAMKMLQRVDNQSMRRQIVMTAVEHVLPSDQAIVRATIRSTRASETRRNWFAHGVWGACDAEALADTVLLIDARELTRRSALVRGARVSSELLGEVVASTEGHHLDGWYVFTRDDLRKDIDDAARAYKVISWLPLLIPGFLNLRDRFRGELARDPLIAAELEKITRKGRSR